LVTAGLIAAGIVFGAAAGVIAIAMVGLLAGEGVWADALGVAGFSGAVLGAATAPVLSWLLLRRIPIGRMFVVCAAGTTIGAVLGWFLAPAFDIVTPLAAAFLGCLLAAVALFLRARVRQPT